jgi:hypothetical protein
LSARPGGTTDVVHRVRLLAKDPSGRGVEGVAVDVVVDGPSWSQAPTRAQGTTDAAGVVEVGLEAGTWRARTRHATWTGDADAFVVPAAGDVLLRMMAGPRLRVLVLDAVDGKPIAGAWARETEFGAGRRAVAGADGIADLGAIHGSWARVEAGADGHLSRGEWATKWAWREKDEPLVVRVTPARPLEVRVVRERTRVPEAGAEVRVSDGAGFAEAFTDAQGVVRFAAAMPAGHVRVSARTSDDREGEEEIEGTAEGPTSVEVVVAEGMRVAGVVVRATDGGPIAGAEVLWADGVGERRHVRRATSDAAGRFALEGLSRSSTMFDVVARAPGWFAVGAVESGAGENGAVEGVVGPTFRAQPTRTVSGRVTGPDGAGVAGAIVALVWIGADEALGFPDEVRTDAQGRYRIEGVPQDVHGRVLVRTEKDGLGHADATVDDSDGKPVEMADLRLPGTFAFDVPFVDEEGKPVRMAVLRVRQRWRGSGEDVQWRTASEGRFHAVEGVARSGAVVEMEAPGYLADVVRIDPTTKSLVAMRPCRARGRLFRAEGRGAVAGAKIEFESTERLSTLEGNGAHPTADAEGRFEVVGLRRGEYRMNVTGFERRVVKVTRDVEDLGDVELVAR